MLTHNRIIVLVLIFGSSLVVSIAQGENVVFVIDRSGSMKEGNRMQAAKEGAKLGVALLDGQVSVVSFASEATKHGPPIHLRSSSDRLRAMKTIDSLHADGGTNYLAALRLMATYPRDTVFIFVSDGENHEGTPKDVYALLKNLGPIHTIGAETNREAQNLLKQMASMSNGSFTQVESPQELTEVLIVIAQRLTHYRSYAPTRSKLLFDNCVGGMIAIGYSAVPHTTGAGSSQFQHRAKLAEPVVLDRFSISEASNISISIGQALGTRARLARILIEGLPMESLLIPTGPAFVTGDTIDVSAQFNKPLDRNTRVEFSVVDPSSKRILSKSTGSVVNDRSIRGRLHLPSVPGIYTIHSMSHMDVSGHDFTREQERSIRVIAPQYQGLGELDLVDFGAFNIGQRVELGLIDIPTTDSKQVAYAIMAEKARRQDGVDTPIQIATDRNSISPTVGQSASVRVLADLDHALPGLYAGRILLASQGVLPQRTWVQPFQFAIREPLQVSDVDLGTMEAGRTVSGQLTLRNESKRKQVIEIAIDPFKTTGGSIVAELEKQRVQLGPGEATSIGVSAISNPAINDRGELTTQINLRVNGHMKSAALQLKLDDRQHVFQVNPAAPVWSITAGEPSRFEITIRGTGRAELPDTFTAEWLPNHVVGSVTVAFDSSRPVVVRENEDAILRGYIISREAFAGGGTIELRSKRNGDQKIPVKFFAN